MRADKQVRIRLLSTFSLVSASGDAMTPRGSKAQGLLAYVALQPARVVTRQQLMGVLWSDRGQAQAQASLRTCLTEIRATFKRGSATILTTAGEEVGLIPELVSIDAEELVQRAMQPGIMRTSVPAWSGDLLTNLDGIDPQFDEWLFFERAALRRRYSAAIEEKMTDATAHKKWEWAAELAQCLLNLDPASEIAHRSRIINYANHGDVAAAMRQYELLREALSRTLDAVPSKETEELISRVRSGRFVREPPHMVSSVNGVGGPPGGGRPPPELPGPSIAVVPFVSRSDGSDHDYLGDGLAENIINNLSRFRDLIVIAGHSTFPYKNRGAEPQEVGRELGARFVLTGSVQRVGDRLRVSAQLIDSATGQHVWAQRYDRGTEDVFAVQDEVTETIVGTLASGFGGRLRKAWRLRPEGIGHRKPEACDYFLRGLEHSARFTKDDCARAREFCQKAAELDPGYGRAIAKIAWLHLFDVLFGWTEDVERSWADAFRFAELAIERDDDEAWGHGVLGACFFYRGQFDRGLQGYRRALELNPNDADVMADFGTCLNYAGQAEDAVELIGKAMRLNPHHPEWYVESIAQALFDAGHYAQSIAAYESLRTISHIFVRLYLTAAHAALGHEAEMRQARDRVLELDPAATLSRWANPERTFYKDTRQVERLRELLRRAGLPE
ncbi:MAG: BTAD domain-containing putative transcriptional regulator [Dongiaceae bacterium]